MVKKLSLRARLTLINVFLLIVSCLILYISLSNSAIMKLEEIENCVVQLEGGAIESVEVSIDLSKALPDISETISASRRAFQLQSMVTTLITIVVASGLTWVVAGMSLKPLRELTDKIENISEQNLSALIEVPASKDEVATLAVSFNQMLSRLNAAFQAQKQFAANAAHELRTPLAVMQTKLEVLSKQNNPTEDDYKSAISSTLVQTDRLSKLVSTLLELLSMHSVETSNTIDLEALVEEVICDLGNVADQKNVKLIQKSGAAIITGNDALIYRAIYNLTENAIKYNNEGGEVVISTEKLDGNVRVKVSDNGPGIEKDKWEEIFDPFYRIDKSRSRAMGGAGLGLALVKNIAELHNGKAYISNSSVNGTTFVLEIYAQNK